MTLLIRRASKHIPKEELTKLKLIRNAWKIFTNKLLRYKRRFLYLPSSVFFHPRDPRNFEAARIRNSGEKLSSPLTPKWGIKSFSDDNRIPEELKSSKVFYFFFSGGRISHTWRMLSSSVARSSFFSGILITDNKRKSIFFSFFFSSSLREELQQQHWTDRRAKRRIDVKRHLKSWIWSAGRKIPGRFYFVRFDCDFGWRRDDLMETFKDWRGILTNFEWIPQYCQYPSASTSNSVKWKTMKI